MLSSVPDSLYLLHRPGTFLGGLVMGTAAALEIEVSRYLGGEGSSLFQLPVDLAARWS